MNASDPATLWVTSDRRYRFLTPVDADLRPGATVLVDVTGRSRSVDLASIKQFEVSEQEARRWAREELGATLDDLKAGTYEVLAAARRRLDERNHAPVGDGPRSLRRPGLRCSCCSGSSRASLVTASRATNSE